MRTLTYRPGNDTLLNRLTGDFHQLFKNYRNGSAGGSH
jgi:hypothetical protein